MASRKRGRGAACCRRRWLPGTAWRNVSTPRGGGGGEYQGSLQQRAAYHRDVPQRFEWRGACGAWAPGAALQQLARNASICGTQSRK